jgi:hypothetical protein
MSIRLIITWILSIKFPNEIGQTAAYPAMLVCWSITAIFRNFQRAWRESHLIGGWQSTTLSLYIGFMALRYSSLMD